MNELKILEEKKRDLERKTITSLTISNTPSNLLDYEIFFKDNYMLRFNEIGLEFEILTNAFRNDEPEASVKWEKFNETELYNDLVRFEVKKKGELTDKQFKNMLGDKRLVPNFNPLIDYFTQLAYVPQEGYSPIEEFASYVTVEGGVAEQERWIRNFKKGLVRTVKCAINPNYFNKQCIVLHSDEQNLGKTSYLRSLTPPALADYYFEGMIGGDRDSQVRLAKYYFTLIDEMANLTRMDINQLKATLSQQTVTARLPYATKDVKMSRITSFWATTNRTDFLMDSQNVRWVIFSVEAIDHSYGNIWTGEFKFDINSLWAEAFYLYRTGFNCEMTKEDLATNEENNIRYHATSTEREMIMRYLEPACASDRDVAGYKKGQPSEVFIDVVKEIEKEALSEIIKLNDKYFYAELSKIAGWKKVAITIGGRNVQGYHYIVKSGKKNDLFNNLGTKLNNNDEKV